MKFNKILAVGVGVLLCGSAFADPIVGNWKMSEKGEEKAIIAISKSGDSYTGVVKTGLTAKAKKTEGKTALTGLKRPALAFIKARVCTLVRVLRLM